MNREILFNAWLPSLGFMVEGVSVGNGSIGFGAVEFPEFDAALKAKGFDPEECNLPDWLFEHDDWYTIDNEKEFVLLQYTNIDDKTEHNIIECDIVKFHYFYLSGGLDGAREAEHDLVGIVSWGTFGWGLTAIKGQHWEGYTGYGSGEGESSFMDLCAMNESGVHEESFEVIGNIFQNPELCS